MSNGRTEVVKDLTTHKGISVGEFVKTEWKGYFKVVRITETTTTNTWNGQSSTWTYQSYHVQYVCSNEGIPTKGKTKVRQTGYLTKITEASIAKSKASDAEKWDRLSAFMFPKEEEPEEEVKEENPYFEPLGGLLRGS
ncbi:MAG: hypothetical protein ACXABY_25965 [Candidatus Thorarchaeota archaeon]|jgi:hypothetical protein